MMNFLQRKKDGRKRQIWLNYMIIMVLPKSKAKIKNSIGDQKENA